jgi:hypothetical protein
VVVGFGGRWLQAGVEASGPHGATALRLVRTYAA